MENDIFDFGFTAVNEAELEAVQLGQSAQTKVDTLYKAILPLLTNLKANADKDYIYWPKRIDKIKEFEAHLKKIYES
jgi:hypothetical protein